MRARISMPFFCSLLFCSALPTVCSHTFVYYQVSASIQPAQPPVILREPPYTTICANISRTFRGAITYTDFEVYPVQGWTQRGGSWSSVTTGYKGRALQGSDNNQGLGEASQYYYNTRLDSYSSLWITAKTRLSSDMGYYGIAMMNFPGNRAYTAEIRRNATGGYLEIRSYRVESPTGWYSLRSVAIPGYNNIAWYNVVVNYTVTVSAVNIHVWLYNEAGSLVVYVSASSTDQQRFTPAYIGVNVNDVTALFEDFTISTADPRYIAFQNTPVGYRVEVWDNLNNLVNSSVATSQLLNLSVISDAVVGTGTDGRIIVKYPDGSVCLNYTVPETDAIIGGDAYTLITYEFSVDLGTNNTSAKIHVTLPPSGSFIEFTALNVSNVDSKHYYTRLFIDVPSSSLDSLTAYIYIANGTSISTPIIISSGSIISQYTSWITLSALGGGYIRASINLPAAGSTATLNIYMEYCTLQDGGGVCVYYPITLGISSGG